MAPSTQLPHYSLVCCPVCTTWSTYRPLKKMCTQFQCLSPPATRRRGVSSSVCWAPVPRAEIGPNLVAPEFTKWMNGSAHASWTLPLFRFSLHQQNLRNDILFSSSKFLHASTPSRTVISLESWIVSLLVKCGPVHCQHALACSLEHIHWGHGIYTFSIFWLNGFTMNVLTHIHV